MDEVAAAYEAVTVEDVARVADEYIREERLRLAVVGPHGDAGTLEAVLGF